MKVLHLIGGGDVGGARVHVLSLINELSKYIDVKIISFRPGMFSDDARAMGIDIEVVKSGNAVRDIKKVVSIIKEGGYKIIHSHGSKANMFALIAKRFTKLPTVTTIHSDYKLDYMHNFLKTLSFGSINQVALRFIDYYIGVSDNFREMLIKRNFKPEEIFTVYNGIDFGETTIEYPRQDFIKKYNVDLKENDIVVGILARLYPVKDIDTLIEAARIALKQNPNLKFVIGGDGEDRVRLENKAKALDISDRVSFLGWVDDPDELMSNLDINVLTSISESFPYSILEGAKFKKATVSSNVGGIPDLIEHGVNGYLFLPGDCAQLAEYIVELASNSKMRDIMGESIFKRAQDKFSLTNMCKTQLGIYEEILEKEKLEKQSKRKYDVVISGSYGFDNIGDDAMLLAIINNLSLYKSGLKLAVITRRPAETKKMFNVDTISRSNIFAIVKAIRSSVLFVYGGGNIIQDTTSSRSPLYYLGLVLLAKKINVKVMFYANGIGPIRKKLNMILSKKIINQVDVITLREELSLQELKRLHIDRPEIFITSDPALTLEKSCNPDLTIDSIFSKEGIERPGPYVGFSVRKYPGNEKYQSESYEPVISQIADYIIDKYGAKPVFIPMQYPSDLEIIENIVSKMKGKGYILRHKHGVQQVLEIIDQMEMLIGMRLHALIFAASSNVPIIGLEYDPKIQGFMQYIKQPSAGDVKMLDFEKLKNLVDEVWNNRTDIRKELEKDVYKLKEKAFQDAKIAVELIEQNHKP